MGTIEHTVGHTQLHAQLHTNLDELVADFITCTGLAPSKVTVMELIHWSFGQTTNPTEMAQDGD